MSGQIRQQIGLAKKRVSDQVNVVQTLLQQEGEASTLEIQIYLERLKKRTGNLMDLIQQFRQAITGTREETQYEQLLEELQTIICNAEYAQIGLEV